MLRWIREHSGVITPILTFLVAILVGVWANWFTGDHQRGWTLKAYDSLLAVAIFSVALQLTLTHKFVESIPRRCANDVLRLGAIVLAKNSANPDMEVRKIRGQFRIAGKARPVEGAPKVTCLCLWAHFGVDHVMDRRPISLTADSREWFFTVRAYEEKRPLAGDIDWTNVPSDVVVPAHLKSVISFPVQWSTGEVLGTVTFDSESDSATMRWAIAGTIESDATKILANVAGTLARIYTHEAED